MWILSADDNTFGGRRLWLRPRTSHLFGRTPRNQSPHQGHQIDEKTVSRQHLFIEVGPVAPGDSARLNERPEVKLTDNSKTGTTLNGDSFTKNTRIVGQGGTAHDIKLGKTGPTLKLRWEPLTFSFSNLPKGTKQKIAALAPHREHLEPAGFKILTDYITNQTTHVVAKKRNNPSCLQGLTQGRWIVTEAFVEVVKDVVKRPDGTDENGDSIPSSLEADFDRCWPKEEDYIPAAGPEPVPRPKSYLRPNQTRAEVFKDYVFVFLSQQQFDNLMRVVTSGGGKALCWEVQRGQSKVEDLVSYVQGVAGHKDDGAWRLSQYAGPGGVVLVRQAERDEEEREFDRQVQIALDQRSIEQNEFLDAILTNDASPLRRQLPEADGEADGASAAPASRPQSPTTQPQQPAQPQRTSFTVPGSPSEAAAERRRSRASLHSDEALEQQEQEDQQQQEPPRKRQRRLITQSRFKGFDDFDPSQFTRPASASPEPFVDGQSVRCASMDVDESSQRPANTQATQRKRKTVQEEEEENDSAMMNSMLKGAAKLKQQRMEAALQNGGSSTHTSPNKPAEENVEQGKTKKEKGSDVMAQVQKLREREDEQRRREEESLQQAMEGVDISQLKDLVKIEEMEIPARRTPPRRREENGRREGWDPAWNGRKNFKKFRPKGQSRDVPRLQRVIVTLEEAPKTRSGMGEEYWLTRSTATSKSSRKTQSQSQSVRSGQDHTLHPNSDDTGDAARFRRRLQVSHEEDAFDDPDDGILPDEDGGRRAIGSTQLVEASVNGSPSQTLGTVSQRKAAGKRPATTQGGTASKRAKQTRLAPAREVIALDDDDDDGLKFRRRRR